MAQHAWLVEPGEQLQISCQVLRKNGAKNQGLPSVCYLKVPVIQSGLCMKQLLEPL